MSATDALLFIDANKFLDLYRTIHGMSQLAALAEQANSIFVTQQVVDEVQRNKLDCAARFLGEQFAILKQPSFDLPDHLFGVDVEQTTRIRSDKGEIVSAVKRTNDDLRALATSILEKIHQSQDEVSKALAPVFAKAMRHTADELQRAKDRRERGNPPGKKTHPLGDQLSWEQVLSQFKKRLWIISRDGDYGTQFDERLFLNPFLYDELRSINANAEVYWFADIPSGIKHFSEKTGVKADSLPSQEVADDIKREEKALPPLDWLDGMASLNELPPALRQQQYWHYRPQPNIVAPDDELPFDGSAVILRGPTQPPG